MSDTAETEDHAGTIVRSVPGNWRTRTACEEFAVRYGLEQRTAMVLFAIARHDGPGGMWPGLASIARYGLCSESTARREIRRLETRGVLTVVVNGGGDLDTRGNRRTNRYLLCLPDDCYLTSRRPAAKQLGSGIRADDAEVLRFLVKTDRGAGAEVTHTAIAQHLGYKAWTVKRCLTRLVNGGWVTVRSQADEGRANIYTPVEVPPANMASPAADTVKPKAAKKMDPEAHALVAAWWDWSRQKTATVTLNEAGEQVTTLGPAPSMQRFNVIVSVVAQALKVFPVPDVKRGLITASEFGAISTASLEIGIKRSMRDRNGPRIGVSHDRFGGRPDDVVWAPDPFCNTAAAGGVTVL